MSQVSLLAATAKAEVPSVLNTEIVRVWRAATKDRSSFTIALSGGSLPKFLSTIQSVFAQEGVTDPQVFANWHVLLADERCVPLTHEDSNLGALNQHFLEKVPIPANQIYGINETLLDTSAQAVAQDYEAVVRRVLAEHSEGQLDCAVLGFGPDGHTCSLFPNHPLLQTPDSKWVASIEDSPKPPPKRITLTLPLLNQKTRHVIFCGAGGSKSPILQKVLSSVQKEQGIRHAVTLTNPPPYPCAMVLPHKASESNTLAWVVDADAMDGVTVS